MLPTIIFGLALYISFHTIRNYIEKEFNSRIKAVMALIACILWTWLYYLSH